MIDLILPWPPTELSPNGRLHWRQLAEAKAAYKHACKVQAKEQGLKPVVADKLLVTLVFYPPTRRKFDLDNLLARMKAGLDALSDVLMVDDYKWAILIDRADQIGGMVKVNIKEVKKQ